MEPAQLAGACWNGSTRTAASSCPGKESHPVPGLGVGDHAAANPGGNGDPLLSALHGAVSRCSDPGRGRTGRGVAALGRAGVLRPRPPPAPGGANPARPAWRRFAAGQHRPARIARYRPVDGGGNSRPGDRAAPADPGRQRQAPAGSVRGGRGLAGSVARPGDAVGSGRALHARRAGGRLHPGDDGSGRDGLHAAPAALSGLSVGGCLCRAADGTDSGLPTPRPRRDWPVRATRMLLLRAANGEVLLERRPPLGIWGGLWSFPECALECDITDWCRARLGLSVVVEQPWTVVRHRFSHFQLDITPVPARVSGQGGLVMEGECYVW